MSFLAIPPSIAWLRTADSETVQWVHFIQCVQDQRDYLLASGVPAEQIANPSTWVEPGDLQAFSNVVSWWPKDAPASHRCPTLYDMLHALRTLEGSHPRSFGHELDRYVHRAKEWMLANKRNPDNPNETREEREARLNRERVARHRLRNSPGSDDPDLDALLKAAKAADHNAVEGRKWLKGEIQRAKSDMDAAIAQAKLDRAERVQRAEEAVAQAELQARSARDAVDNYRINK